MVSGELGTVNMLGSFLLQRPLLVAWDNAAFLKIQLLSSQCLPYHSACAMFDLKTSLYIAHSLKNVQTTPASSQVIISVYWRFDKLFVGLISLALV